MILISFFSHWQIILEIFKIKHMKPIHLCLSNRKLFQFRILIWIFHSIHLEIPYSQRNTKTQIDKCEATAHRDRFILTVEFRRSDLSFDHYKTKIKHEQKKL